nr:hypothetical protein [uncultured Dongia sp.]
MSEVLEYRFEELLGRVNAMEIINEELACAMIRHGIDRTTLLKEIHDGAMRQAKAEYSREIGFSAHSRYTMRENVEQKLRQMAANLNIRTSGQARATGRY